MACGSLPSHARLDRTFRGVWRYMMAVDGEKLRLFSRRSRIRVYTLSSTRGSAQEIMSDDDDCPRVSLGRASSRRGLGGDESCISDLGRRIAPSLGGMEKSPHLKSMCHRKKGAIAKCGFSWYRIRTRFSSKSRPYS